MYCLFCFNCYRQTKNDSQVAGNSQLSISNFTVFIFLLQVGKMIINKIPSGNAGSPQKFVQYFSLNMATVKISTFL